MPNGFSFKSLSVKPSFKLESAKVLEAKERVVSPEITSP